MKLVCCWNFLLTVIVLLIIPGQVYPGKADKVEKGSGESKYYPEKKNFLLQKVSDIRFIES